MRAIGRFIRTIVFLAILIAIGAVAFAYSGIYDVRVGSGHTAPVEWYLETLRERSIARRAESIRVPDLTGQETIAAGAIAYNNSCSGCHGRPGRESSSSFEPRPPGLTRGRPDPAEAFWVTRNGLKMSAMPARGEEQMSDDEIWSIVAFLQVASGLTEGEYREMTEPPEEDEQDSAETAGDEPTEDSEPESPADADDAGNGDSDDTDAADNGGNEPEDDG